MAAIYQVESIPGLSVGMNMRWQDDISRVQGIVAEGLENAGQKIATYQDAYSIITLMAKYDINKKVSVSVNANNVTDEKYINSLYWAQGYYGAPVNYTAILSWQL